VAVHWTIAPGAAGELVVVVAWADVHAVGPSVYVPSQYASWLAVDPVDLTHTPTPYTPDGKPVVSHAHVAPPNAVLAVQLVVPGGSTKNSYWGVAVQPVEVAVNVIVAPGLRGDATSGLMLADVQPVVV